MRLNKTKSQLVWFKGFDGKTYKGHTLGMHNDILVVVYNITDGFRRLQAKTYLDREDCGRIIKRY